MGEVLMLFQSYKYLYYKIGFLKSLKEAND